MSACSMALTNFKSDTLIIGKSADTSKDDLRSLLHSGFQSGYFDGHSGGACLRFREAVLELDLNIHLLSCWTI